MTNIPDGDKPGTERARDEQRPHATPRYHGGAWTDADGEPAAEGEQPAGVDAPATDEPVESGGDREGMGRAGQRAHEHDGKA